MADSFLLKVITPSGVLFEEQVSEVYLPSSNGEIGILPHHTAYTGLLGVGVLHYLPVSGGRRRNLVVAGGFVSFSNDILTILADSADTLEAVDRQSLSQLKAEASAQLEKLSLHDPAWSLNATKYARAEALEKLVQLESH